MLLKDTLIKAGEMRYMRDPRLRGMHACASFSNLLLITRDDAYLIRSASDFEAIPNWLPGYELGKDSCSG